MVLAAATNFSATKTLLRVRLLEELQPNTTARLRHATLCSPQELCLWSLLCVLCQAPSQACDVSGSLEARLTRSDACLFLRGFDFVSIRFHSNPVDGQDRARQRAHAAAAVGGWSGTSLLPIHLQEGRLSLSRPALSGVQDICQRADHRWGGVWMVVCLLWCFRMTCRRIGLV